MAGFEYAISVGVDAIELDLVVTADDVVVCAHDPFIDEKIIRETSWANLRTIAPHIPSFHEVLALADRSPCIFDLELKMYGDWTPPAGEFARLVLQQIGARRSQLIIRSFDFPVLDAVRRLAPDLPLAAITYDSLDTPNWVQLLSPHYRLVNSDAVRTAHGRGMQIVPWTANEPEIWDALITAGVDGIVTDDPAALIRHVQTLR